jgi:hypothetical protein
MHRRYKKVLLPAFGIPEAKEFLPVFTHVVTRVSDVPPFLRPSPSNFFFQLADRWAGELENKGSARIVNVADGLMRVTLDACVPFFLSTTLDSQSRLRTISALDSARGYCVQSIQTYSLELIIRSCF